MTNKKVEVSKTQEVEQKQTKKEHIKELLAKGFDIKEVAEQAKASIFYVRQVKYTK